MNCWNSKGGNQREIDRQRAQARQAKHAGKEREKQGDVLKRKDKCVHLVFLVLIFSAKLF